MRIIIENADQNDFNELAKLARAGKINTFCMTDDERPQGEWICITEGNLGINTYKCSLCGHRITCTEGAMKQHKGCYCGAVMKGGAE